MRLPAGLHLYAALLALPWPPPRVRIYQTNSAGDVVDVIDPSSNKVVMPNQGYRGAARRDVAPDGTRAYITCEAEKHGVGRGHQNRQADWQSRAHRASQ